MFKQVHTVTRDNGSHEYVSEDGRAHVFICEWKGKLHCKLARRMYGGRPWRMISTSLPATEGNRERLLAECERICMAEVA